MSTFSGAGDHAALTGRERTFGADEIIVSKTDAKGRITYANRVFQRVSGYTEAELLGKPHNLIRHPQMPRCVFKYLWDTLGQGREVFAYVVNRAKNGDHYWVFAHVTPSYDLNHRLIGYHSSRRVPCASAVAKVKPIYDQLLAIERRHRLPRDQWGASLPALVDLLTKAGVSYDEFVFSITEPPAARRSSAQGVHAR